MYTCVTLTSIVPLPLQVRYQCEVSWLCWNIVVYIPLHEARVCGLCPLGLVLRLAVKGVSEPGCQDQILAGGGNFSFFCGVYPVPISQPGAMEIQLLLFLAGDGGIRL